MNSQQEMKTALDTLFKCFERLTKEVSLKKKEELAFFRAAVRMVECGSPPIGHVLLSAAKVGWAKMIIYLLENTEAKQGVNSMDGEGNTPLHFAYARIHGKSVREEAVNCLLSHGAKRDIRYRNNEGWVPMEKHRIFLISDDYQGKTTFFIHLALNHSPPEDVEKLKGKFESIRILPQMVEVVNITLKKMQRDGKLNRKELMINGALEVMEKVQRDYPSLEELKWDSEKGLKDALQEICENKGFQNALERKYLAMWYFFQGINVVSKPGYVVCIDDLFHLHLKPKG